MFTLTQTLKTLKTFLTLTFEIIKHRIEKNMVDFILAGR